MPKYKVIYDKYVTVEKEGKFEADNREDAEDYCYTLTDKGYYQLFELVEGGKPYWERV